MAPKADSKVKVQSGVGSASAEKVETQLTDGAAGSDAADITNKLDIVSKDSTTPKTVAPSVINETDAVNDTNAGDFAFDVDDVGMTEMD